MAKFGVPTAFIDGKKLAEMSVDEIQATKLTVPMLLSCVSNIDQVAPLVHADFLAVVPVDRPTQHAGRLALRTPGAVHNDAAVRIQAAFRMFMCRKMYLIRSAWVRGATRVQQLWRGYKAFERTRLQLRKVRFRSLQHHSLSCRAGSCRVVGSGRVVSARVGSCRLVSARVGSY
jgi:hypothetical protein